jgi:hypothetical protein
MSSSRSIAAARNRRAGDPPSTNNSRPGTSINSQSSFSPQSQSQPQKKSATAPNSTPNVPISSTKLTISDAIGLITLRLGRVEQYIQTAEYEGGTNNNIPANTQLVDKSVINSIVNRLDFLEKKEKESSSNNKLETEIRDIKDLLMTQMLKYDKFTNETDKRFTDVDSAFVEMEKFQETLGNLTNLNLLDSNEPDSTIVESSISESDVISTSNLKNIIEQELACSQTN